MRTITVFNHKGGCGKTTTVINLAAVMAQAGKRVLLIDFDPQAHATVGCGIREDEVELSTWDVMKSAADGAALGLADIAWEIFDRLYLAPAAVALAALEQTLAGHPGRDRLLHRALERCADRYDITIIDCGPGIGLLAINALVAADTVLLPVDLGFFSIYGLGRALETMDMITGRTGRSPDLHVLPTLYDSRARTMRKSLRDLRDQYGPMVLNTVIRHTMTLREAAAMGSPICEFEPQSRGHEDYLTLAQELAAGDLQLAFERQRAAEAETEAAEEAHLDEKLEEVYGAVLVDGGVRFVVRAPGAGRVRIAGDFNGWATNGDSDLERTADPDVWRKHVKLPPGRYAYRLIVDDEWRSDPANPYVESNPYGELNSVVEVQ